MLVLARTREHKSSDLLRQADTSEVTVLGDKRLSVCPRIIRESSKKEALACGCKTGLSFVQRTYRVLSVSHFLIHSHSHVRGRDGFCLFCLISI